MADKLNSALSTAQLRAMPCECEPCGNCLAAGVGVEIAKMCCNNQCQRCRELEEREAGR